MHTGCYFYSFLVKLVMYFILFCLVDFCTTIIGEINMINSVDKHPIPPIWHNEKLIRLKTGCHATPLFLNPGAAWGQISHGCTDTFVME